jgi:PLP dependent protein
MTVDATAIRDRWSAVKARVDAACVRANRDPADVTLIAVSKGHPAEAIRAAADAGAVHFGENYAQELAAKRTELGALPAVWHFIGRLQRNKVKLVIPGTTLIHAVDSVALAEEIGRKTATSGGQDVLLAIAGEASKAGVTPEQAVEVARQMHPHVRLQGLMTMPPPSDDPEASRPAFSALRVLRDRIQDALGWELPYLSMGMSGDYEVAIDCGATHVRIGTSIFGARA